MVDVSEHLRQGKNAALGVSAKLMMARLANTLFESGEPPRLDRYELLHVLGRGATGIVYAAFDPQLQRKVALKLIPAGLYGDREVTDERVLAEARAIAQISHPNVVTIHEVGTTSDGDLYLSMELIDGGTLRQWNRRSTSDPRPQPWRAVIDMFAAAGRGLAAVHAAGLIHRDFKPDNVLVGADAIPRVTDFGLARIELAPQTSRSEPKPEATSLAGAEQLSALMVAGTPAYMSPEQHRGEPLDARSDQFSFCVALWEATYGELPFEGIGRSALRGNVLTGKLREPKNVVAVPAWVESALRRGLAVAREDRWPTMPDLLEVLERDRGRTRRIAIAGLAAVGLASATYFTGETLAQERDTVCLEAKRAAERVWLTSRLDAIRGAILATKVPYAIDTWRSVSANLGAYQEAWLSALRQTCDETQDFPTPGTKRAVLDCLNHQLLRVDALVEVLGNTDTEVVQAAATSVSLLETPALCVGLSEAESIPAPPPPSDAVEIEEQRRLVAQIDALIGAGRPVDAQPLAEALLDRAAELGYPPLLADVHSSLGRAYESSTRWVECVEHNKMAALIAQGANYHQVDSISTGATLACLRRANRDAVEATRWVKHAEQLIQRFGEGDIRTSHLLNDLGVFHDSDPHKSLSYYLRSLRIKREALPSEHEDIGRTLLNLSVTLAELGRFKEGIDAAHGALDAFEANLGPHHPFCGYALGNLMWVLAASGDLETAETYHDRTARILGAAFPTTHVARRHLRVLRAAFLVEKQEYGLALDLVPEEGPNKIPVAGEDSDVVSFTLMIRGHALLGLGRREEAIAALEKAAAVAGPSATIGVSKLALARAIAPTDPHRARRVAEDAMRHIASVGNDWMRYHSAANELLQSLPVPGARN